MSKKSKNSNKRDVVKVPAIKTAEWRVSNARQVKKAMDGHLEQAKRGRPMKALGSAMMLAMLSPTGDSKYFKDKR